VETNQRKPLCDFFLCSSSSMIIIFDGRFFTPNSFNVSIIAKSKNINPFDQPAVELRKDLAKKYLQN
jgi:hypothetical protein